MTRTLVLRRFPKSLRARQAVTAQHQNEATIGQPSLSLRHDFETNGKTNKRVHRRELKRKRKKTEMFRAGDTENQRGLPSQQRQTKAPNLFQRTQTNRFLVMYSPTPILILSYPSCSSEKRHHRSIFACRFLKRALPITERTTHLTTGI